MQGFLGVILRVFKNRKKKALQEGVGGENVVL